MKKGILFLYNCLMKVEITNIYDDQSLVFNKETGRYELTMEYVKANFDMTLKDDGILQKRITKNSRIVYNFIMGRTYSGNNRVVTFFLNRTMQGRRFLTDILHTQLEADLQSGYNDLGDTPAINVSNGSFIDRNVIKANLVSVLTEDYLDRGTEYFGFNLFASCLLAPIYFQIVTNNGC